MRIVARLLTGVVLRVKDRLDLLPGGVTHQCFMFAGILDALIADDALVVRVPEEAMEVGDRQGLACSLSARHAVESTTGQLPY